MSKLDMLHKGKKILGLKETIDLELLPFLQAFWKKGGVSYGSCQGGADCDGPSDMKGFVIIEKKSFSLLQQLAPKFGMTNITKENGDGGYCIGECGYKDIEDDESSRYYVEFKLKGVDYTPEED